MSEQDAMIVVNDLHKTLGTQEVLAGVELTIPRGETCVIMGRSGCGKSVLLKHLIGLLKPDSGTASVVGLDVVRDATKLREEIGLAGQYAAVDENLTGHENLWLFARRKMNPFHRHNNFGCDLLS